jgi:jacalin-like lectin domain-containing protein
VAAPGEFPGCKAEVGVGLIRLKLYGAVRGGSQSSEQFGGDGGTPFQFSISDKDYLTLISGTVGVNNGSVVLFSLQFFTQNGNKSPVFGSATSTPFNFQCPPGYQISGIFGRSGSAVDALGVYLDQIPA